nr:hypothetical protein [Gemmatimonadales bacterium]
METTAMVRRYGLSWKAPLAGLLCLALGACASAAGGGGPPRPAAAGQADPRIGLGAGWMDAEEAASNLQLLVNRPRPEGFFNPTDPGDAG